MSFDNQICIYVKINVSANVDIRYHKISTLILCFSLLA